MTRVIFDQQGGDGLIFDLPIQQVKPAPAGSGTHVAATRTKRPVQQAVYRDNKECEWPTE